MRLILLSALAVFTVNVATGQQAPAKNDEAADAALETRKPPFLIEFNKLRDEYVAEHDRLTRAAERELETAKTAREIKKISDELWLRAKNAADSLLPKLLAILLPHAKEEETVEPLIWCMYRSFPHSDALPSALIRASPGPPADLQPRVATFAVGDPFP
jgi:hypothetical protein